MTRALLVISCISIAVLMTSQTAESHARLKPSAAVAPRSTNPGIKSGPCGGLPRLTPAVVQTGSTITVTWEETIQHPGRYEFYFSAANDQNFQMLKMVADTQDGTADLPHQYTTTLTMPSQPCTACTLQMIQVMTENPLMPSLYYSCADIVLQTGPVATPTPGASPTPTPSATPVPPVDCLH